MLCVYHNLFICSSIDGYLGCFCLLAIANSAAVNIHIQGSVSVLLGVYPRRRIARSYGDSTFNFLSNHHAVFHRGCTILRSHGLCPTVPVSPHPHQPLLFSILGLFWLLFFIYIAILVCVKWYLVVVLIYISLMTNGVDHLFM